MGNSIKKFIKYYLLILLLVVLFLPVFAQAQSVKDKLRKCWTAEECLGPAGGGDGSCTSKTDETNYCFKLDSKYCGDENLGRCFVKPADISLQVPIPGTGGGKTLTKVSSFPTYLKYIYSFFTAVIGIVAVAYIAFGGFQWIMAAGSPEKINQAKDTIQGALIGLLLAVGSYVILNLINERLVNIDELKIDRIKPTLLMTFCSDPKFAGVKDWVLASASDGGTDNKPDCGLEYVSQSNPTQRCIGVDCSHKDGDYCVPKDDDYHCGDKDELFNLCESISFEVSQDDYKLDQSGRANKFLSKYDNYCSDADRAIKNLSRSKFLGCNAYGTIVENKEMVGGDWDEASCYAGDVLMVPRAAGNSFQYIDCTNPIAEENCFIKDSNIGIKPFIRCVDKNKSVINKYVKCVMGVKNPVEPGAVGFCGVEKPDRSTLEGYGFIDGYSGILGLGVLGGFKYDYKEVDDSYCNNKCAGEQKCWVGVGLNNYDGLPN